MADCLWTGADVVAALKGRLRSDAAQARASNWQADGVAIDTRDLQAGDIFVALPGTQTHGHDFVAKALAQGAVAALVEADFVQDGLDDAVILPVDDTLKALEDLGRAARARCSAHITAITGSVGKTGTKAMLAQALAASGKVHAAERSFNNHIGVPLTLARMPADCDYAVFELGMNHAGEIAALVEQVQPHSALITTIGTAHIENFASMHDLAKAKAEILTGLLPDGVAILPLDNPYFDLLAAAAADNNLAVTGFSSDGRDGADVAAIRQKLHATCSCVTARILTHEVTYKIAAAGAHLVTNSLAVLAAVHHAGADLALAALSLAQMDGLSGRGARYQLGDDSAPITLIDESYNANPTSMAAALTTLGLAPRLGRGRRIAVLGDMAELGDEAAAMHAALSEKIDEADIDLVVTCGPLMRHLNDALSPGRIGAHADGPTQILESLRKELRGDDVVMVKGSNASRMHVVSDGLRSAFAENPSDTKQPKRGRV
jgi:UDP-N-acetylmuramoyl-tripeptide--D-alanyl-D-alanine ligase